MTTSQLVPAIVVPLIIWRIYLRVRRTIGRQLFHPGRLVASLVLFGLVTALIAFFAANNLRLEEGLGAGLLLGAMLGWFGVHLTRFEFSPSGRYYTPNTYIGLFVTLLLVGRIVYRVLNLGAAVSGPGAPPPPMFQSPLTLVFFGITAGYYMVYAAGLLWRSRHLATAAEFPGSTNENSGVVNAGAPDSAGTP